MTVIPGLRETDGLDCSGMTSCSSKKVDSTYLMLMNVCGFGDGVKSALKIVVFVHTINLMVVVFTIGEDSVFTFVGLLKFSMEMVNAVTYRNDVLCALVATAYTYHPDLQLLQ